MIEVKELRKSFDDVEVLKGITTTFETGKVNLIIGQSGSGKTVFLKSLLNVYEPSSGGILFDGRDVMKMSREDKQILRSEIGTVFQGSALFDSMTVEENISFPLDMFTNLTFREKKRKVLEVIGRVNLEKANKKYPSEISGGMQKRVAIARAIVNNPKYLFCDEPNSGLDPYTSNVIDDLLLEITKEYNTTTIINTHDMNSVMTIGEKILYLRLGIKEWEGDKNMLTTAKNKNLLDFVYSSELFKQLREFMLENHQTSLINDKSEDNEKIISTIGVLVSVFAYSQVTFGLRANALFPTDSPKWENLAGSVKDPKSTTGFNVGLAAKIGSPVGGWFVMPEIYYTSFKTKSEISYIDTPSLTAKTASVEAKTNRIDVPVLLGHSFLLGKLAAFVGPVASYNLSTDNTFNDFKENSTKEFTVGYQFGAQATLSKFVINARYEGAFSKDTRVFSSVGGQEIRYDNRPSMFIVGIGYNFN